MTIYFVDEDHKKYRAWLDELEFRGLAVRAIENADYAFDALVRAQDIELVIIDVMLSAAIDGSETFSRDRTGDFLQTGLVLLDQLVQQRPDVFPRSALLLTNTINKETFARAREYASRYDIELVEKQEMTSPFTFGDRIEAALQQVREGQGGAEQA